MTVQRITPQTWISSPPLQADKCPSLIISAATCEALETLYPKHPLMEENIASLWLAHSRKEVAA